MGAIRRAIAATERRFEASGCNGQPSP